MRRNLVVSAMVFIVTFIIGATGMPFRTMAAPLQQVGDSDQAIQQAFQAAAQQDKNLIPGFIIYGSKIEHILYSNDGNVALVWVSLVDPLTNEGIAAEPGLVIARKAPGAAAADSASWAITFSTAPGFLDMLRALPQELISDEMRASLLDADQSTVLPQVTQTFTGYKLPWAAGQAKRLTGSIGHFLIYNSCSEYNCRYAYDFADGTMFPLLAAKGGTVVAYRTTCQNSDHNCTNYLTLEDRSTSPTTYQLYYHMAYNSIPNRLRTPGTTVLQGEYIGDVDNTGASTGHHLHFHVFASPTAANYYWGPSVKIAFDEVPFNEGQPRTCYEATNWPGYGGSDCSVGPDGKRGTSDDDRYVSANVPAHLPEGTLDIPADNEVLADNTLRIKGTARDDMQVTKIEVSMNYDGTWKTVDNFLPDTNGVYEKVYDLCSSGLKLPRGPFSLAVKIFDREGGQVQLPVKNLVKSLACVAPPACTPGANEVALYANTDFRGACQKFAVNSTGYTANMLGLVGDNNTASVQVGSGVLAVLYDRSTDVTAAAPAGRLETLDHSDAGLADNRIGLQSVSGLKVVLRTDYPKLAIFNPSGNRLSSTNPSSLDSLVLSWRGGANALLYDVELSGPGASLKETISNSNSISVGSLTPGTYQLTVAAKNDAALNINEKTFTVVPGVFPAVDVQAASTSFQDNMEAGPGNWIASGLWHRASVDEGGRGPTQAWIFNNNTNYSDTTYRAGDLTSPPVAIPADQRSFLRFSYFMDTEDGNPYWDQRRVQVSVYDSTLQQFGPFADLLQLSDDKQVNAPIWLNSGPISLAGYAGKIIRVRFHFDTIDDSNNSGLGWMIDDVSVTASTIVPDTSCADTNDSPANAAVLSGTTGISGTICPENDIDFYRIDARAGQQITFDIDAKTLMPASNLDSQLVLLDSDQHSVIAENDDEQDGVKQDSLLTYLFQRDGTYYVKIKAWNYPGAGDPSYTYVITARQEYTLYHTYLPAVTK